MTIYSLKLINYFYNYQNNVIDFSFSYILYNLCFSFSCWQTHSLWVLFFG